MTALCRSFDPFELSTAPAFLILQKQLYPNAFEYMKERIWNIAGNNIELVQMGLGLVGIGVSSALASSALINGRITEAGLLLAANVSAGKYTFDAARKLAHERNSSKTQVEQLESRLLEAQEQLSLTRQKLSRFEPGEE